MQLQKEKKHLQKIMQELELARKVELLFMLLLNRLKISASLAVLDASEVFGCSEDFKAQSLQKGKHEGFYPWFCVWRADVYFEVCLGFFNYFLFGWFSLSCVACHKQK